MPVEEAVAPTQATPQREFEIPVEQAAPVSLSAHGKRFTIPVESATSQRFKIPVESAPQQDTSAEGIQRQAEKAGLKAPTATLQAHVPSWFERVENVFREGYVGRNLGFSESFTHERARTLATMTPAEYSRYHAREQQDDAHRSGAQGGWAQLKALTNSDDTLIRQGTVGAVQFTELMTPEQRRNNPNGRRFLDALSEFTSPESAKTQLEWMVGGTLLGPVLGVGLEATGKGVAALGAEQLGRVIASPKTLAWAMHGTMMGPVLKDLAQNAYQAVKHADANDPQHEEGAWGAILGNLATLVALHYGSKALDLGNQTRNTELLNKHAQAEYQKPFQALTPEQKTTVLYRSLEEAAPSGDRGELRRTPAQKARAAELARHIGMKTGIEGEASAADTRRGPSDANPSFQQRVEQELARSEKGKPKPKPVAAPDEPQRANWADQAEADAAAEKARERLAAAKRVIDHMVEQHHRNERYKAAQAQAEARARQAAADAETAARRAQRDREHAADPGGGSSPSVAAERGFTVSDDRSTARGERGYVTGTERENYPVHAPGTAPEEEPAGTVRVNDQRPLAEEPMPVERASELERPVQEYAEAKMGASFSSLPLERQKVIARYFERFQPEKWDAFKGTQAYATYRRHADIAASADPVWQRFMDRHQGSGATLQPGADLHLGLARLLLGQTDLASTLKAAPQVAKALNQYTEQHFGPSFEALPIEDKAAALGGFLRDNPEHVRSFLSAEVAERVRNGQAIDLANLEAELVDRQQVQFLMEHREDTRRALDQEFAGEMLRQARTEQVAANQAVLRESPASDTSEGGAIHAAAQGVTRLAERINLDSIRDKRDLFAVEAAIRRVPEADRTPDMRSYLEQFREVRRLADGQILREFGEEVARNIRNLQPEPDNAHLTAEPPLRSVFSDEASEYLAHLVVDLSDQRTAAQRAADDNRREHATPEQRADAAEAQDVADFLQKKADEVVARAQAAQAAPAAERVRGPRIPLLEGGPAEVVLNDGERVPVRYAVAEAADVRTSHLPLDNYRWRPDYPQEVQPWDYQSELLRRQKVDERGNNLDPVQIHTDTNLPMAGPPIIRADGVVFAGNGRMMSQLLAIARRLFGPVRQSLMERAAQYGLDPVAIAKMKDPVLVRVMDEYVDDPVRMARYGMDMNRDPGIGGSEIEEAVAFSRLMTDDVVSRLAGIFEKMPEDATVRQMMAARGEEIIQLMREAGLIDPNKAQKYTRVVKDKLGNEHIELTDNAKILLENVIAAQTVVNPEILRRVSAMTKSKLARVGIEFIRMRAAGAQFDLRSYHQQAVELVTRTEELGHDLRQMLGAKENKAFTGGEYHVERILHPERFGYAQRQMFTLAVEVVMHEPVHEVVEALAMALESRPKEYARLLGDYATKALDQAHNMWGAEPAADVFNQTIGVPKDAEGNKMWEIPTTPENWGAVGAMPEAVKADILEARGPLPVEPAEQAATAAADLQPDQTAVTSLEKGTEARNVAEFRRALARLEGFTAEQAEAIGHIFEFVLPRALSESFENLLKNRMLALRIGGVDAANPTARGAHFVEDGQRVIEVFQSGDPSTVLHELAHFVRKYLGPGDQATLNEFVGAKPGEAWTEAQEEKFAEAFERYHWDGGRRKGKLEKAFAVIHQAMQAVYDALRMSLLAKPSPAVVQMFDRWYDWTRPERKPFTATLDVKALEESVRNAAQRQIEIPADATLITGPARGKAGDDVLVFTSRQEADAFLVRNQKAAKGYSLYAAADQTIHYVRAKIAGKRLYQQGVASLGDLARQARAVEAQLKRTTDPREEARLRAMLNSIENRMGGATLVFGNGGTPPQAAETQHLVHGLSEMPSVTQPTTPAQAAAVRQVYGDLDFGGEHFGGEHGRPQRVPDAVPGHEPEPAERVSEPAGGPQREHAPPPVRGGAGAAGARVPSGPVDPMTKVPAAALADPPRQRGTPVVDPALWKRHAEELGLPPGTPAVTVRLPQDLRSLLIFPGQAEAVEVALSGLQQYDGVVLAAPTGSGKTFMSMAIADQLLGRQGNKVGLIITKSKNLIHDSDGYVDVGRRMGIEVEPYPKDSTDIQGGGVYAMTYADLRGNKKVLSGKNVLSVPWDFVIFDESGEARKWMDSQQGKAVVLLGHAAKKAVYVSATPIHTAIEMGYMHKLGLWPPGGFFGWARQFGVVATGPNTYTGGYNPRKLLRLRQQLIERGQWVSLHRDMDGVTAYVGLVKQTPEVRQGIQSIRQAFGEAAKIFTQKGQADLARAARAQEVIYLKRYIESARLPQALEAAEKAIAHGWSPVIFSEYRSGSDDEGMKFFNKLPKGVADQLNALLPPLPDVVDAVRERFGDQAAIFAGSANQLRGEEREGFMAGVKRALYATYAAGGIGVGFHDKLGARPRMGIFLGLPWSGIMFEQSLGRTWRYGTKSNVVNLFLASDTLPEIKLLATKILPRMRALNAAVHGEAIEGRLAKLLREAAGIHADMVDYELGAEDAPDAAHFEHTVTDQDLPLAGGPEVVHGLEARDAIGPGKGMKYRQAVSKLYQLARDMVTLYRGEARPGSGKAPADWIQESDAYKEQQQAQRRWFTPSLEDAKWYQEDAGEHGHIVSVQVPRADLEKYSALNNPEARRFVHNTKVLAGQNDEYFLPRHLAARAEPYTSKLYQLARENVKEQTDTAEFKAWFGASQVVDESGKPLRVYHGTTRDFAQFDAERLGGNTGHVTAALGFFFTRDPEVAELFNSEMGTLKSSRKPKPSEGAQTLPVFLKIHRPYEIAAEAWKQLLGSDVDLARMERQRKLLQSRGYDGVHIKGDPKYKGDEYSADQWVAFQPTQIKSAIGNRGSFDAQHPNILYQQARDRIGEDASAAVTKAFADPSLTPQERFALLAARAGIELHAAVAGGEAVENGLPGQPEMERVAQDARIGLQLAVQEHAAGAAERASLLDRLYAHLPDQGKIALYKRKAEAQSLRNYITDWVRIYHTSGEQAIRKYMADAGGKFVAWGRDIQRLLIARSHLLTQYQGEFMEQVRETLAATPEKLFPLAVRVLEGRATSRDPQVLQAAEGLREFFAYVRQRLADSGAYLPVYEGGEKRAIAYQDIEEDPHYWPHIYHWTEPLVLNGEVTTLAKIQDIPVGTERREQMIAAWAGKMGVSKLEADLFFEKHRRDIRLAGNLEKGRFSALPGYGESARELSIYIRQASEILANIKTVGQEREKINPWIFALPDSKIRKLVDGIVTADLNPLALGEDNRTTLRLASQSTILTMMGMSSLKVGYHAWKTTMVTNTRSLARGILSVAAHPREVPQLVREAGILNDYVRQQMMMEYGLHSGGLAQGLLTWTGFTPLIWVTRLFAAASGRVYLEHYIVPELQRAWKLRENVKANTTVGSVEIHIPGEAALRRQLKDLYAFSDADIDRIAREGPDTNDVKRAMITAADWTTGSGRPSELPPVMHLETDSKVTQSRLAFVRLSWQLKTFAFKTANLVNRTVFEGLRDPGWKDKEYQALARFMFNAGAAGMGMQLMMIGVKSKTNPAGAEEDKRRLEAALHNPKDLLWLELANVSFAVGLYPAKLVFDTLGTHSPQDKKKANARLKYGLLEEVEGGIIGSQALALRKMVLEEVQTFRDDGIRHKKTPPQRRKDAAMNFVHSTVPAERAVEGLLGGKPAVAPAAGGPRPRRTRAARRARGR